MVEDEIIFQTDIIIAEATERVTKELSEKYSQELSETTQKYSKQLY